MRRRVKSSKQATQLHLLRAAAPTQPQKQFPPVARRYSALVFELQRPHNFRTNSVQKVGAAAPPIQSCSATHRIKKKKREAAFIQDFYPTPIQPIDKPEKQSLLLIFFFKELASINTTFNHSNNQSIEVFTLGHIQHFRWN